MLRAIRKKPPRSCLKDRFQWLVNFFRKKNEDENTRQRSRRINGQIAITCKFFFVMRSNPDAGTQQKRFREQGVRCRNFFKRKKPRAQSNN